MIESKEVLVKRLSEILSKKSFTPKAKDCLLRSILFAYTFYNPPKYIRQTRDEYISEYLKVLENMNGYAVIELSDINAQNESAEYFRENIKKSQFNRGNLELVDGRYIPVQNGSYYCSCKGYTWNKEKMMFMLDENNPIEEVSTIHHEMTHLSEGACPFPLNSAIPFSFEVRKMLYEGRATTRESYVYASSSNTIQEEMLEDGVATYQVVSECSYPLYGKLYQLLQIIFGDEILEKFSKNDDIKNNFINELKELYPNIAVEELFSHIIYILSCSSKKNREALASSVHHFARSHAKKIEWVSNEIKEVQTYIDREQQTIEQLKKEEQELRQVLITPELLQAEYEKDVTQAKEDIEALYKDGSYTEEEYKEELNVLEAQGTLEYYKESKQYELEIIKSRQESLQQQIKEDIEKIAPLKEELQQLEQNQFPMILERVCLKNPSLDSAFSYIEELALRLIQEERKGIQETDSQYEAILDKVRILLQLKERTVLTKTQKNASLVS